jgi:hypothetical protein
MVTLCLSTSSALFPWFQPLTSDKFLWEKAHNYSPDPVTREMTTTECEPHAHVGSPHSGQSLTPDIISSTHTQM